MVDYAMIFLDGKLSRASPVHKMSVLYGRVAMSVKPTIDVAAERVELTASQYEQAFNAERALRKAEARRG